MIVTIAQALNLLSILCYAIGASCLAKGFWPTKETFSLTKQTIRKGGKIVEESPALEDGISDDEVPEAIKKIFVGEDLARYKFLLKRDKEVVTLKSWGRKGTYWVFAGCLFAAVAQFVTK
ncbi:MAG: hypothetical protein A2036_03480 [Omnitrophica bacterium GWA2_50_21]|nr:MAG: hypothetical protein A2036_03480 [Omnitrophica bacterium GWA2_50_21]